MGWESSDRRQRLPSDWPARAAASMRTHNGVCHVCGQPGADAVDHIVPGDDHSPVNLAPIHQDVPPYCHRIKSAREGVQARAELRRRRTRPTEPHPGARK
jgi:5-methylcytosine-specific restriction enzyme A